MKSRAFVGIASALALVLASAAHSTTYSNADKASGGIYPFGAEKAYGQVFTLATPQTLQDWAFYFSSGNPGNLDLVIAAWDGSRAVGPALYTALGSYAGQGGAFYKAVPFNAIDLSLAAGTYISYITTFGVSTPVSNVQVWSSGDSGGLPGQWYGQNSGTSDPLTLGGWITSGPGSSMLFTANLTPVPEPASYGLMLVGLGLMGFVARRRKNQA